ASKSDGVRIMSSELVNKALPLRILVSKETPQSATNGSQVRRMNLHRLFPDNVCVIPSYLTGHDITEFFLVLFLYRFFVGAFAAQAPTLLYSGVKAHAERPGVDPLGQRRDHSRLFRSLTYFDLVCADAERQLRLFSSI